MAVRREHKSSPFASRRRLYFVTVTHFTCFACVVHGLVRTLNLSSATRVHGTWIRPYAQRVERHACNHGTCDGDFTSSSWNLLIGYGISISKRSDILSQSVSSAGKSHRS